MPDSKFLPKGTTPDKVLRYLRTFLREHDRLPRKREIAKHFGLRSTSASGWHLTQLVKRGVLEKEGTGWRFRR